MTRLPWRRERGPALDVAFPFPGGTFPADLGALVAREVLDGAPVLFVAHERDNTWVLGDAASGYVVTRVAPLLARDPSLGSLATMAPGWAATRASAAAAWRLGPRVRAEPA